MKKILLLLLLATFSIQAQTLQNPTYGNIKLKNNTTDNSATKVNVQSTDGTINTISKSDLVNVVEVNDVPSLPLIGEAGKIYVVKNLNKIYRWNGTFYQELSVTDISGKEDIANKQNSLAVDGTNTKYSTVTAVNAGLALKANSASPTFTGTPTAPTATAGTNTTQIATTAFVTGAISTADSGNVKLTGAQTITGTKTFTGGGIFNTVGLTVNSFISVSADGIGTQSIRFSGNANNVGSISTVALLRKNDKLAIMANDNGGSQRFVLLDGANVTSSDKTFTFPNQTGTFAITNNPTPLTATSFIKSSTPTTNILLAGGGDLAQNTAFNKNFGTTAGTVVEGNYPPAKDGTGASGTWGINISGNAASATSWGGRTADFVTNFGNQPFNLYGLDNPTGITKPFNDSQIKTWLGLGSNAYTSTAYLPLSGGTLTGTVTATSYTATSLPVFENNALASSLAVGQFYRTSTGVLMVKF